MLFVGQDNLFEKLPNVDSHHVVTRPSYTPDATFDPTNFRSLWFALWKLIRGDYHLAVLPAIDLEFDQNVRLIQHLTRPIIRFLSHRRFARKLSRALLPGSTHIAILDRYDAPKIHSEAAILFNADSYWKVNLPNPPPTSFPFPIYHVPMWIFPPQKGWLPLPWEQKDIDVFAAFSLNAPPRARAIQWLRQFASKHPQYRIVIPDTPLPPDEYWNHMKRSRICLSPEGIGFHCFRHYQCMPCGAIPFVTRNVSVYTDLVDQTNCFLYDDEETSFLTSLQNALQQPDFLPQISQNALNLFHQRHTPQAVALHLLHQTIHPN